MVHVNANLELSTYEMLKTGHLIEDLEDLTEDSLYITFIARERPFDNEIRQENGETFMTVVLPYEEVLETRNFDLLAYTYLDKQLDQLHWMDVENMREKLRKKMAAVA
jgi:hypothetical protein